jgi:hypothetical protein
MKKAFLILCLIILCASFTSIHTKQTAAPVDPDITANDTLIRVDAQPENGFNFPYYIFIPGGTVISKKQVLLIEPNNTGINDTLAFHDKGAMIAAQSKSLGNQMARKLKCPYLVPAFTRPAKISKTYTHAFDRDAAKIKRGKLIRIDLQLINMINNSRSQLQKVNIQLYEKVLLNGFSASGTFVNRFTAIHPEMVMATASGGINALAILPVKSIGKTKLNYPLGVNDFEDLFQRQFNLTDYRKIPQFIYLGANDTNDAVLFDDAYSNKERKTVYSVIGKNMHDRWKKCESIYKENNINATFTLYENIGHGTDRKINNEIAAFFLGIIEKLGKE